MSDFPTFETFYEAVHHRQPFPWQSRLAALVHAQGWPSDIGVPTGLGKTASIDIAVWSLAAQAARMSVPTLPRRIWYVVDRRLLVDAASEHAQHLAELLEGSTSGPVSEVAKALRGLCATTNSAPLHVRRLRGGADPSRGGRTPDPAQPAIICSTVAMYGSRLLFRGYGSSRSMWPIDAAHAGTDSLVLLDEAHLARPLQRLVELLPQCDANRTGVLRYSGRHKPTEGPVRLIGTTRAYPMLVNLTATGSGQAFDLDENDRANPVVAQRLTAAKPTRLVATTRARLAGALAQELLDEVSERGPNTSAVVFVNDPATARAVSAALQKSSTPMECLVLTGQLRDPDADEVRNRLLDPRSGAAAGTTPQREIPLVVVATQTLEVGADLDFDICLSQTAGVRALTQRWGRLNRLGQRPTASGVLVHPVDADGGLYADEPKAVWERLSNQPSLNLSPSLISQVLGEPRDLPERVGELLPNHLWEFAKTTNPPVGAAPPEVFFDSLDDRDRNVSLLWRVGDWVVGQPLVPAPSDRETVDVPIGQAREFLSGCQKAAIIADDGLTVTDYEPARVRPGATVVVPASAGGYSSGGWDPQSKTEVTDLSPALRCALHLTAESLHNLGITLTNSLRELLEALAFDPDEGPDNDLDLQTARALGEELAREATQLRGGTRFRIERFGSAQTPVLRWEHPQPTPSAKVDELDELSNAPRVGLTDHCSAVSELAQRIAGALDMPPGLVAAVGSGGVFHDIGKADTRFQLMLGNTDSALVAKSQMSQSKWRQAAAGAGWPAGGRHELLSVQLINAWLGGGGELPEPDLVRHLVITHHGRGRPVCWGTAEGAAMQTTVQIAGGSVTATTDTRITEWSQPDRFRTLCEEYGYWGLALLEAVVRQADHRVSAATEVI